MDLSISLSSAAAVLARLASWTPRARALLCFAAGLLGAVALPPVSLPLFFFAGFVFFYTALASAETIRRAFFFSWLYGLGFHLGGLYWISASLFVDIGRYFWVLPFSLLALPSYLALLLAACTTTLHRFRGHGVLYATGLALALFASDILRHVLLGGFPWNPFGSIWAQALPLLQSLSLFGIYGLTLMTLLLATFLAETLWRRTRASAVMAIFLALVFSALALWGEVRLQQKTEYVEGVRLRLVQGAVAQSERRTQAQRMAAFSRYVSLSTEKAESPPTHIIWPETAAPFLLNEDDVMRKALARIIPRGGALITGAPSRYAGGEEEPRYYNSVAVVDDAGAVLGLYHKAHLVPFGEFIPLRGIVKALPVAADVIGARDFSAGDGPRTLRAPALPSFSPMVCYEAIFTHAVADETDRPAMLLHVTNDAWFGNTSGPYQHFAMARMRAIEEGLPLVRAANTGISAVVDAYGRIIAQRGLGEMGILDAALPKALPAPPYAHTGFIF